MTRQMNTPEGSIPEAPEPLLSRRDALLGGARLSSRVAAGLAFGTVPVALAAAANGASAQDRLPDVVVDVLNFALLLEHLGVDFYTRGLAAPGLLTGNTRAVFEQIRKHEVGHARYIESVLRDRAAPRPAFDFTGGSGSGRGPFADVFTNPRTFLMLSQAFEDLGVRAIKGQAPFLLPYDSILQSALRMHSVEARHASQVRHLRGQKRWIVQESRGDLPESLQPIYDGEDNTFHFILAPYRVPAINGPTIESTCSRVSVSSNA